MSQDTVVELPVRCVLIVSLKKIIWLLVYNDGSVERVEYSGTNEGMSLVASNIPARERIVPSQLVAAIKKQCQDNNIPLSYEQL